MQYVSETLDLSLKFDGEVDTLDDIVKYIDSDFARSKTDWKSIGGHIFMLARAVINHLSKS